MGQIEVLLTSCQKGEFRDIDMLNKYILMEETGIGARYKRTDFVTFYSRTRLSVFKAQQEDLGSRSHLLCSLWEFRAFLSSFWACFSTCSSYSSSICKILGYYDPLEGFLGPLGGMRHTLRTTGMKQQMRHSRKEPKGHLLVR